MQSHRQYSASASGEVQDYETIESIFGRDRKYEEIKDSPKFIMFAQKLRDMQDFCRKKYLDLGEAVTMIQITFNYIWGTIPYGKLDDIKQFLMNNWFRNYAILEPDRHQQIMAMTTPEALQYQEFYNSHGETGHKIMRNIDPQSLYWMKE